MFSRIAQYVLNREAAARKQRPDDVIAALGITPGQTVADIGAGGGYYVYRFAEAVGPTGIVYAIDPSARFLAGIGREATRRGFTNVRTVAPDGLTVPIPDGSVDLFFTRDTYHHLHDHVAYFRRLKSALRPGGRIVVVDLLKQGLYQVFFPHASDPATIVTDLAAAGYERIADLDLLLPRQSFQIFAVRDEHTH